MKESTIKEEDKSLLAEILLGQKYALELVSGELADIENGLKKVDDARLKELESLYDRLVNAGY